MKSILLSLVLLSPPVQLYCQTTAQLIAAVTGNGPTVTFSFGGSAAQLGNLNPLYYTVVANFVGGSLPSTPLTVRNGPVTLSSSSFVALQWTPVSGATSYDVLKTTTPGATSGSIALTTGITATTYNDIGGSLSSYSLAAAPSTTPPYITYNSRDYSPPALVVANTVIGGSSGSCTTLGGDLTGTCAAATVVAIRSHAVTGVQGNGALAQLSTGSTTTGDAVSYDANGNAIDAGVSLTNSNVGLSLGKQFECTHGTNATCGVATLNGSGTVTVSTSAIAALATTGAGAAVALTLETCSSCGSLSIGTVTPGTSFVINSTSGTDASHVYWEIRTIQ